MYGLDTYLDYLGYSGGGSDSGTWLIICIVIALVGTVAAIILLIGKNRRTRLTGFWQKLSSHVNFENFAFAMIVKILYVFIALFLVSYGLFKMFSGGFLTGLLIMTVGTLAARIYFEAMMIYISIFDQVKETNRLLRGNAQQPQGGEPQPYGGFPQQDQYTGARQQSGYAEPSRQSGYAGQAPPRHGRYDGQVPQQPVSSGGEPRPQPDPPRQYPGGYDPMHRG